MCIYYINHKMVMIFVHPHQYRQVVIAFGSSTLKQDNIVLTGSAIRTGINYPHVGKVSLKHPRALVDQHTFKTWALKVHVQAVIRAFYGGGNQDRGADVTDVARAIQQKAQRSTSIEGSQQS